MCARLEQAAGAGEILVGERTVAAARGAFEFAESATVQAKGKPGGVVCRRLVRALSLMRPRGISGLQPVFAGRGGELADLQQAYGRVVASGRPLLVTVVGDAGVGKTRLVREFWRWLGGDLHRPVLRSGRCLSYGHGITYWPLGEVLKEHFGILESDPPEVVAGRLAPAVHCDHFCFFQYDCDPAGGRALEKCLQVLIQAPRDAFRGVDAADRNPASSTQEIGHLLKRLP